ncbi:phosphofructokinase [Flavobacterium suaedae]|uniref:Phosphofructokinase n=1 Tax=Flavobacterium suaedae TaxID=1767027 RepID=A0ABQ1JUI2_9FLAO|nr:1-phosphofructokinase family hexose kinase [Flavobacterium suaedae]GGB74561.1 phosphofructokinase [Flavobacterium suaedae]
MTNTVLTITLNPTVDKSSSVANIKPEKKLRCEAPNYEPGGGGINVSRGLVRLGIPNSALFTSGGRTGKLLEELLEEEKVNTLPITVLGETRENFIVVDTASNEQYRFGMPGQAITDDDKNKIIEKIKNLSPFPDIVVISGSLPPGITPDFLKELIQIIKNNNSKVVVDTSGEALSAALDEGVYLVKPNIGELSRMTNIPHLDNNDVEEAAKTLINKGKAEIIVVSMGPQGAYLITKEKSIHLPAPSVKKLSTVGAGDSMVAGMVSVMAKGGTPLEMARMGVACGSAATMNPGTGLFKPEDSDKLYNWLTKCPI